MSIYATYIVARWDRPLTELRINNAIEHLVVEGPYSWARTDGWQCLVPEEVFYAGDVIPPVALIEEETRGPVLGLGVESSSVWHVAFRAGRTVRRVSAGAESGYPVELEHAMVQSWGHQNWRMRAAESLAGWAAPFADVSAMGLAAAMEAPHIFAESKLDDLKRLLTLVPDRGHPWWSFGRATTVRESDVPGAIYAVDGFALRVPGWRPPVGEFREPGLAVVRTVEGWRIWDRVRTTWLRDSVAELQTVLLDLAALVAARGWVRSTPT
ncbi:hypothetical protein [Cellulomonas sp. PhB150]|uniref:hypothetical protein n=1 Tax=Cellulomonas sp. PhB150 TaxID=2485188 RepID=UPI000F9CF44B|nr:hypothetical protein [Cellulomonas sp. PhB150]ROS30566.1 hypothetical protein EDF34_0205 [Cellulomonas sp. PhB150]